MPREWHDRHAASMIEDPERRKLYRDIVADKKPYFMRYIYPTLMRQYNTYIKNTNKNALREFQMTVDELLNIPYGELTERQHEFLRYYKLMRQYNTYIKNTNKNALREFQMTVDELLNIPYGELTERQHEFLRYYKIKLPVGVGNCVMNRICVRFEEEFDHQSSALSSDVPFDYSIMKSGAQYSNRQVGVGNCVMNRICVRFEEEFDHQSSALSSDVPFDYSIMKSGAQYSNRQASEIRRLCESYNKKLQNYAIISQYEKPDDDDVSSSLACMKEEFLRECENVCQNRFVLCDIILDIYAIISQYEKPDDDDVSSSLACMKEEFLRECENVCQNRFVLCDIILDICYRKSSSKRFAWDICADTIIDNLLTNNGMSISAPVYDPDGDIQFRGRRYSMITRKMEEEYEDCSE